MRALQGPPIRPNARTRKAEGEKWVSPVAGGEITTAYGLTGPHWSSYHDGADFAMPAGTPIRAVTGGRVVSVGDAGAYGLRTVLRHAPGFETHYCHQSSASVAKRQEVAAGQVIGAVGESGNTTGPHLHFMVVVDGQDRDPAPYLSGSVDLPSTPTNPTGAGDYMQVGGSTTIDALGLDDAADTVRRFLLTIAIVAGGLGLVALGLGRTAQPLRDKAAKVATDVAAVHPAGRAAKGAGAAKAAGAKGATP